MDEILPSVLMDVLQISLGCAGIVVVIAFVNVWNLLTTVVLSIIFYFLRAFYLQTSRDVKRLEAVSKLIEKYLALYLIL